jgi:hypothetical protein
MSRFPGLRPAGSGKVTLFFPLFRLRRAPPVERPEWADRVDRRALAIWPRLNHKALHRCGGDPARIAIYVAHRTKMTPKAIETLISD